MIVTPPFIQAVGGGGGGGLPKPNTGQFTWIFQSAGATMSNVAQGLQLVSPVAGAGGTAAACIGSTASVPSSSKISLQTASTDFTNIPFGANQVYGPSVGYYDNVHGQMCAVCFSGRSGQTAGTYAIGRMTRKVFSGADGGAYHELTNGITPFPNILQIKFDGSTFTYLYGSTLSSLTVAGSDSLATIRALDPAFSSYTPDQAAIWQENQDGPPVPPNTNTSVFSGFQVSS